MKRLGVYFLVACVLLASPAAGQDLLAPVFAPEGSIFGARDLRLLRALTNPDRDQWAVMVELTSGFRSMCRDSQRRLGRLVNRANDDLRYGILTNEQQNALTVKLSNEQAQIQSDAEKSLLTDLELVLREDQAAGWQRFLRARRALAMERIGNVAWPMLDPMLERFGLTPAEYQQLAEVLEQERTELDKPISRYLAAYLEMRTLSRNGKMDSPAGEQVRQTQAEVGVALLERMERAVRAVAGGLAPERGQALREFFERDLCMRALMRRPVRDEFPFKEYLAISTLSQAQQGQMRTVLAEVEKDEAALFKDLARQRIQLLQGRSEHDHEHFARDANEADKKWEERKRRLREQLRGVLTDAQRKAYDEGLEPPLEANSMWFSGESDDQEEP